MLVLVETLNSHNNLNNNYFVYFTKHPQQYYVAKFRVITLSPTSSASQNPSTVDHGGSVT